MIRAVLDANVLVSGIISPAGTPAKIIQAWSSLKFLLIASPSIVNETTQVLRRSCSRERYKITDREIDQFSKGFQECTILVPGTTQVRVVKEDPGDNKYLAAAIEGEVDYIVSGDNHLLKLEEYKNIDIISPKTFLWRISLKK